MPTVIKKLDPGQFQLKDQVVSINRVTKVVKGGKNLSFAALVVVGDPTAAVVGYGSGKAKEVPQAIRKGIEAAKKNLMQVNLRQTTIPHSVLGRFGSGMVLLKPAPEGTGVIAGGAVRAVVESVGIRDILTKTLGSTNKANTVQACMKALQELRAPETEAALRGKSISDMIGKRRAAKLVEARATAAEQQLAAQAAQEESRDRAPANRRGSGDRDRRGGGERRDRRGGEGRR